MPAKKRKAAPARKKAAKQPADTAPPDHVMVEMAPGYWVGVPTTPISDFFESIGIPPDAWNEILKRGGGYDGVSVSAELERVVFEWLHDHGRSAVSIRTPCVGAETMAAVVRRFPRKPPGEWKVRECLRRLEVHHSADFRSVVWHGTSYAFTKSQAACVKVLWEAREAHTPELDGLTVVTNADVAQARLIDVFRTKGKTHPAWGTMIVQGQSKGAYRLSDQAANDTPAPPRPTTSRKTTRKTHR